MNEVMKEIDGKLIGQILSDITIERFRQQELHGVQNRSYSEWLTVLVEEVGELAQCIQRYWGEGKETDSSNLDKEAIQVAAVALHIVEKHREGLHDEVELSQSEEGREA